MSHSFTDFIGKEKWACSTLKKSNKSDLDSRTKV